MTVFEHQKQGIFNMTVCDSGSPCHVDTAFDIQTKRRVWNTESKSFFNAMPVILTS
jgi:hypothetical protein